MSDSDSGASNAEEEKQSLAASNGGIAATKVSLSNLDQSILHLNILLIFTGVSGILGT